VEERPGITSVTFNETNLLSIRRAHMYAQAVFRRVDVCYTKSFDYQCRRLVAVIWIRTVTWNAFVVVLKPKEIELIALVCVIPLHLAFTSTSALERNIDSDTASCPATAKTQQGLCAVVGRCTRANTQLRGSKAKSR
jgi:hypothetical protein